MTSAKRKPARKVRRPPAQVSNADRRDAIAAAALKLFSEFGFAAVSNKELGKAAGINPALIYYYFKDKDDLFQFVVRRALADALAVYEDRKRESGSAHGLEAWLSSNVLLSAELSRFLKVVLDYAYSANRSPLTDDAIARFYDTEIGILADSLSRETGLAAPQAADLARLVSVFLDGMMVARAVRPEIDVERLVNSMRELLGQVAGDAACGRSDSEGSERLGSP